jgi:hypothetical protein
VRANIKGLQGLGVRARCGAAALLEADLTGLLVQLTDGEQHVPLPTWCGQQHPGPQDLRQTNEVPIKGVDSTDRQRQPVCRSLGHAAH